MLVGSLRPLALCLLLAAFASTQDAAVTGKTPISRLAGMPVHFVENRGVFPDEVAFYMPASDRTVFFGRTGLTFLLQENQRYAVKLDFVDGRGDVQPRGERRKQATFSYFRGKRADWKTGLATFGRIVYPDLWPKADLVYRAAVNRFKYDVLLRPGADPERVQFRYRGATSVTVTSTGALRIETPAGSFEDAAPVAYQDIDGRRVAVEVAYTVHEANDGFRVGFTVGDHDESRLLVIDPALLAYCGYLGGVSSEVPDGIAVDSKGNVYVTGGTNSNQTTFPATVGPDLTYNGTPTSLPGDAFIAKVDATGTKLLYCGYIGGISDDAGCAVIVDDADNAYVTGWTRSNEATFPVKVGPDLTHNGAHDVFVAKVNAAGTALDFCGYFGGAWNDYGFDLARDTTGRIYVAGWTYSDHSTFPVKGGPDLTFNSTSNQKPDAYVARIAANGSGIDYCGYIGGPGTDWMGGVAVDKAGCAYIAGRTDSDENNFPVAVGPDLTFNGLTDMYVAKVNAAGTGLVYCGYIGGIYADGNHGNGGAIKVDASGNAYVTGLTYSDETTFPVRVGPDLTYNGNSDVFVAKVDPAGTGLVYCGYIGGAGLDAVYGGIDIDPRGNAYVAGSTFNTPATFPLRRGPGLIFRGNPSYYSMGFVAKVPASGGRLDYCGYIGGTSYDTCNAIAVDPAGNAYVTGSTYSSESSFPVVLGPDLSYNGGGDAFVAKVGQQFVAVAGNPKLGGTVIVTLKASDSIGLPYQFGSSFGIGPIPIDTRNLGLSVDPLLVVSVRGLAPSIFQSYSGIMPSSGEAGAIIIIPVVPGIVGLQIHTAAITLDPSAPSGVKAIADTASFRIQ